MHRPRQLRVGSVKWNEVRPRLYSSAPEVQTGVGYCRDLHRVLVMSVTSVDSSPVMVSDEISTVLPAMVSGESTAFCPERWCENVVPNDRPR